MNRVTTYTIGLTALIATTTACGSSNNNTSTPATTITQTTHTLTPTATGAATVKTANTPLGPILVDASGNTLYLFEADKTTTSTCNGTCAAAWPPATTTGKPTANGVNATLLGTTTRTDNTTEVTYNGHPLYRYSLDTKPGQTNGQGVNAFGALWYTVNPNGNANTTKPTGTATTTSGGAGGIY